MQTAERTVTLLLAVAGSEKGLKAKEISDRLGQSRQVVYHLLHTLVQTGILRKNEQSRYVLGLAAASVAEGFRRQLAPPEHLAPRVRAAVAETRETAYAGGWVDGRIAVLATARGESPVQAAEVPHGYSSHGHARAAGKLLLALAPPKLREAYLAANPLVALTASTITSREALYKELEEIAARGYAIDDEEFSEGLCCLAVPVEGLGSHYALGISVPTERFHLQFDRYLAALRKAARLGFE
ncbi:MAG: IclR family transcriptional regulator C-terminal domain-containing protein [Rhodovibrionaceae bacterium]